MKLLTKISTSLLALTISTAALADDNSVHTVGVQVGGGGLEYKNKDTDGTGLATSYLYYNYKLMSNYYVELGLLGGADVDWNCDEVAGEWECFSDNDIKNDFDLDADKLDMNALVIALKSDLSLSKRNRLYGKVGVSYYDYDIDLKDDKAVDENGIGFMLEGGWEYRWDTGIGMNVGLQYQKMGDLNSNSLNIGISYSF